MRKFTVAFAVIAVLALAAGTAIAGPNDGIDGSASAPTNNGGRVFLEIHAHQDDNTGTEPTGQWVWTRYKANGAIQQHFKGNVKCLEVDGNDARVWGFVTESGSPKFIGRTVAFRVIDAGRGDRFGWEFSWAPTSHVIPPCAFVNPTKRSDQGNFRVFDGADL